MGYFRGWIDDILSRIVEAILAIPLVIVALTALAATGASTFTLIMVIAFVFAPIIARTVRAAVLAERELEYVAAARLRGERPPYVLFAEILPNVHAADPGRVHGPDRLRHLRRRHALVPRLRAAAAVARLGPPDRRRHGSSRPATGGSRCSRPLAIASLVIAVNLISDGIQQAVRN